VLQAVAIDGSVDLRRSPLPPKITVLDLNDPDAIIAWIDQHAITLKG
jgi:hypothetical protein